MQPLEALARSGRYLLAVTADVGSDQLTRPTPCTEWDVRALLGHLIATNRAYAEMLHGATLEQVRPHFGGYAEAAGPDPAAALADAVAVAAAAFAEPGALERTVHHPMGQLPAAYLLDIRISENVVHGLDLARAVGSATEPEPELVAAVLARIEPMAAGLPATGYFSAPTGELAADATPTQRLLHLLGR